MSGVARARALEAPAALPPAERAIASSVLYAALFDYPLTLAQLRQTLIESEQTPTEILTAFEHSSALRAIVAFEEGYFFPRGHADLIAERRRRALRSRRFLARHRLFLAAVCALPYVRLVALSGSIAHMNLEGAGDLDLFIITRGRHVWSVTVAVVVLAKLFHRRRTVCANFVLADSALALDQQDLFSASQIIHLKPLVGAGVYAELLAANPFVARFYPNFHPSEAHRFGFKPGRLLQICKRAAERLLAGLAGPAERLCRSAYRRYLLRRASTWRSPEQVRLEDDRLKLHTQSHRRSVLDRFNDAVRQFAG
jgi:hypothetical protein